MQNVKKRIFDIIQIGNKHDIPSTLFDYFISIVILINLTVTFMLTYDKLSPLYSILNAIDLFTIIIFTIEYILRLFTSDLLYPDKSRYRALLRYIFSFFGLIDILTILPFYLPLIFPQGAVAFRMFRVFRIFRLFRFNAQSDAFSVILNVMIKKRRQLISSMSLILIFMLAASLCMYSLEHTAQPESFRNAFSGIWWATSTLLTVGYGDIYPVTILGQILAIFIAFLGVGMVAIPTGIISAAFVEEYNNTKAPSSIHLIDNPYGIKVEKDADGSIIIIENDHTILIRQNTDPNADN